MNEFLSTETICALATPHGMNAIAVIRLSGEKSFEICNDIFIAADRSFDINNVKTHTIHFGTINRNETELDEVLISIFRNPRSYTGEDSVEISCHGSVYIQQKIIELLIDKGARIAKPGEFTMRAFMNKKMDLSQAEAVADLIISNSEASHRIAIDQMRGGYSLKIKKLRQQLVDFTALIELELDFGEEDVEFANRDKFLELIDVIRKEIKILIESFSVGNALKHGVPVAIIGKPNVGKSTLLNVLLNEEKAIVTEIPGTTRDVIEDTIIIEGVAFRFIDTAGLRESEDVIENMGIEKTYEKIDQASIILYIFDISKRNIEEMKKEIVDILEHIEDDSKKIIIIANKIDELGEIPKDFKNLVEMETLFISAKRKENIQMIHESLLKSIENDSFARETIVSNARHYEALSHALISMEIVYDGLKNDIPTDLLTIDIRQALHYLGEITGEISTDEILGSIFSRFCIGK